MYFRKLVIQMVTLSNHEGVARVWQRARGGLTNLMLGMLGSRDSCIVHVMSRDGHVRAPTN